MTHDEHRSMFYVEYPAFHAERAAELTEIAFQEYLSRQP